MTAVGLKPDIERGQYSFLQDQVITDVLTHARREDWRKAVSAGRLWLWRMGNLAAFALFVIAVVITWRTGSDALAVPSTAELGQPDVSSITEYLVTVDPGDVELERGSSLLVLARFDGRLPSDVDLVTVNGAGDVNRVMLAKSTLDDPVFGGRLAEVNQDLTYHVEFAGQQSDVFRVTTFVYPELLQADATIVHPEYTDLGVKTIEDVRRFSVIEGSTVTLTCLLNKPVASAILADDAEQLPLTVSDESADTMTVTLQPRESRRFQLLLVDDAGRENREPPEFVIEVIPNEPPQLAVEFPGRDTRVSPLEEMSLMASAQDDFGLAEYGLVYQTPSGDEETLVLGESATAEEPIEFEHLLSLEDVEVSPQQLISYFFYADDVGPDGEMRRTFSDMFFAEVRHFDEEYRQMPFQQGQQQQQQQQEGEAGELLDVQRQIVSATWNTIRKFPRTPEGSAAAPFVDDVGDSGGIAVGRSGSGQYGTG